MESTTEQPGEISEPVDTTESDGTAATAEGTATAEETVTAEDQVDPAEAITMAPGVDDTVLTTTSMVTTGGTEASTKKRRRAISKLDAANEFVYGRSEESWTRPERRSSTEIHATVRPNRAQTMRRGCIMKRVQTMELERSQVSERYRSKSPDSEPEVMDPLVARPVPKAIYEEPKIPYKDTNTNKFRYLYRRVPPGFKVYFKRVDADPKKKPPFVVSIDNQC